MVAAVEGSQQKQVGGKFEFAVRVARSFVDIDDAAVVAIVGAHGKVHAGRDFFVRTGRVEGLTIKDGCSRENVDMRDTRECGRGQRGEAQHKDSAAAKCHCGAV